MNANGLVPNSPYGLVMADRDSALAEQALDVLVREGFDSVYGARPMRRVIQKRVENPLAEALLAGTFQPGDNITVDADNEGLIFGPKKVPQAQAA